ncbi:MAG: hypothetical protein JRF63_01925, partial [Deltaproteobacteria bacterium]|nr:hypothetical protein [Deltaproteobacteria bacterium]
TDTDTDADTDSDGDTDTDTDSDTDTDADSDSDSDADQWEWHSIEGSLCGNGSQAGFSTRLGESSEDLLIFFEQGNACFNYTTCLMTPDSVTAQNPAAFGHGGIFEFGNENNPVGDFNMAYLPYCTGDVYAGSNPDGNINGIGDQMFVGGDNFLLFVDEFVAMFPDTTRVVLVGFSSGAFGAPFNYDATAEAFGDGVTVYAIGDGGVLMRDAYLTPCLQELFRTNWGLNDLLPTDCTDCFNADGGGLHNVYGYMAGKYPNAGVGLISSMQDATIRTFYGYGLNDCNVILPNYPADQYQEGMEDLITYFSDFPQFGAFLFPGTDHGRVVFNTFYTHEVEGTLLVDWFDDLINDNVTTVGP